MTGVVLFLCGCLLLVAGLLILRGRVELGTRVAMWSPFVRRDVMSGRLTPARLKQTGTYLAIAYAVVAWICGVAFLIGGVVSPGMTPADLV